MMRTLACLFVCVAFLATAQAQQRYEFPDNPSDFVTYVADMLVKTQKPRSSKVAEDFKTAWNGLGSKEKIIALTKKLVAAKATAAGTYTDFFAALAYAVNDRKASSAQIDEYLHVAEKLAETKNTANVNLFFERTTHFFKLQALNNTRTQRTYAYGNFKFDFLEKPDEALAKQFSASGSENDSIPLQAGDFVGAVIRFQENINLTIATPFDSTALVGTQGVFLILKNKFLGKKGTFDWHSVQLDPKQVYVEVDSYTMDVAKPILAAKNVMMHYKLLFDQPIKGDFEFVSRARKDIYASLYPKFISESNNVVIGDFGKTAIYELAYQGGFSLEGRKIYSASRNPQGFSYLKAKHLLVEQDGSSAMKPAFTLMSKKFAITDSIITSPSTKFSLYLGNSDSLYHANLELKYFRGKAEVQLIRDRNSAATNTPFINSFHKFYIDADVVRYNLPKDSVDMFMLSASQDLRPAVFESFDFFDRDRYAALRGLESFNPLRMFVQYAQKNNSNSFNVRALAQEYKKAENNLRNVAIDLKNKGYVDFDEQTGLVTLGQRTMKSDSTDLFINILGKVKAKQATTQDMKLYDMWDHDNYRIESVVQRGANASLSRGLENVMILRGISRFPVSNALNVNIIPDKKKQQIKIYQGRGLFLEEGEVTVGNFRFFGKDFFFLYDEFSLEMPNIDKVLFSIADTTDKEVQYNEYGGDINFQPGRMVISDKLNKAGTKKGFIRGSKESYESYPKLTIEETIINIKGKPLEVAGEKIEGSGVVFFATDFRQKFSYDSLRSVFVLNAIDTDSLTSKIPKFAGRFISTIFPKFNETLIPMQAPDLTMGFIHKPPKTGYDLYPKHEKIKKAHVNFNRDLVMDKMGLSSGGEITYLTTTLKGPEFVFMPDSVTADNTEFRVASGKLGNAEFAEATGKTAQLRWNATEDKMVITNKNEMTRLESSRTSLAQSAFEQRFKDKLFTLYGNANPITLRGDLIITSEGSQGNGQLARKDFSTLSMTDVPFNFRVSGFSGGNTELRINSKARDPYVYDKGDFYISNKAVLEGTYVDIDFDFSAGKTTVKANPEFSDFAALRLPYPQYKTTIKEALWDLNKQTIKMDGDSTSLFTSTLFGNEDEDPENLFFRANKAFYDIPNLTMQVDGIPYINTADASIVPKGGRAIILKDSEMQELKEARVLIDTLNRYHKLFNGNIKIKSRLEFEGDATYQFVNVQKDTFNIKFDKFQLVALTGDDAKELEKARLKALKGKGKKKKGQVTELKSTYAQGTVDEKDKFYITSRIIYKGLIKMYATRKDLSLDGFIKLDLSSRSDFDNWIPYKSDKGDAVSLDLSEKTEVNGQQVTSGLHFTPALELYTTFMSPKKSNEDKDVMLASGMLDYNPAINEFKIEPKERREGKEFTGNKLIFDDSKAEIYYEGIFDLFDANMKKYAITTGSGRINTKDHKLNLDLLVPFDLPLPYKTMVLVHTAVLPTLPEKSFSLDRNSPLASKIANVVGNKSFKRFIDEYMGKPSPTYEAGDGMKKPFVFSSVNFNWSDEYKTLFSVDSLHLLSISDKMMDTKVPGYIEFRKNTQGDGFTFYIQPTPEVWYFAEWEGGVLSMSSSDEPFNQAITTNKAFQPAAIDKVDAFKAKFKEVYGAKEMPAVQKKEKKEEEKKPEEKKEEEKKDGF
jgi:hypothetical protein